MTENPENMIEYLRRYDGPPVKIMEVCGTHTAAIFKSGIRSILPKRVRLVSGPGCPVCVTQTGYIDRCIRIAETPGNILACFGDMLKVPGSEKTLSDVKGEGGGVRMIYSPFDLIPWAKNNPSAVFTIAAVGFETTAPAYALLIEEAKDAGIKNIKLLPALKSAVAAIDRICKGGESVDAFICPGHVSVVTGSRVYEPLAAACQKPFVVAGFEDRHILSAVCRAVKDVAALRRGEASAAGLVSNLYPEAVRPEGNQKARALIEKYFDLQNAIWRGLGMIPGSGYVLKADYAAWRNDSSPTGDIREETLPAGCRCGDVILGRIDPADCPLFGAACTPTKAIGPCMVSSEGACGIHYRNR
ncbi:MAG: hydrogenase formation protein HypD [Clostridiales Family XIII bacterium]|jgi:hydrogenase expression/formation protein HypD|nr:hydrogenase formation protein HypD [Clostridiales Family XIII bacterium]